MKDCSDAVGLKISRLLQTQPERGEVIVEGFGPHVWINLIAELEDGRLLSVWECECEEFTGDTSSLRPAVLVQDEYTLSDVEGHQIVGTQDPEGEFALALDNNLFLSCPGSPSGNCPWLYAAEDGLLDVSGSEGPPHRRLPLPAREVTDQIETDDEKCVCPQCHVDVAEDATQCPACGEMFPSMADRQGLTTTPESHDAIRNLVLVVAMIIAAGSVLAGLVSFIAERL